jgi:hypothetical protein
LRKKLWSKKGATRKINRSEQTKEIIGENVMKNQLSDLNDHLFVELAGEREK